MVIYFTLLLSCNTKYYINCLCTRVRVCRCTWPGLCSKRLTENRAIFPYGSPPSWCLSLNLESSIWNGWPAAPRSPCSFLLCSPGAPGVHHHMQSFMWLLEIQTQALMPTPRPTQQPPHPLSHRLSPILRILRAPSSLLNI